MSQHQYLQSGQFAWLLSGVNVHERWRKLTVVSEGSRVEVSFSVVISLIAKDLLALQAVGAVPAALVVWLVLCQAHTLDELTFLR